MRRVLGVAAAENAVGAGGRPARRCALAGAAGLRAALAAGAAGTAVVALVRGGRAWGWLARTAGALLRGAAHVARTDEALSAERGARRAQAAFTDARRARTVRGARLAHGAGGGTDGGLLVEGLVRPDLSAGFRPTFSLASTLTSQSASAPASTEASTRVPSSTMSSQPDRAVNARSTAGPDGLTCRRPCRRARALQPRRGEGHFRSLPRRRPSPRG